MFSVAKQPATPNNKVSRVSHTQKVGTQVNDIRLSQMLFLFEIFINFVKEIIVVLVLPKKIQKILY